MFHLTMHLIKKISLDKRVHIILATMHHGAYTASTEVQCDQKENKLLQALQIIIGHVVVESYGNKRSMHGRRQFVVSSATL
jgi:hypothetical protein